MTNQEHYEKAKASNWTYQPEMKAVKISEMEVEKTYFDLNDICEWSTLLKLESFDRELNCICFKSICGLDSYKDDKCGLIKFGLDYTGPFYTSEP